MFAYRSRPDLPFIDVRGRLRGAGVGQLLALMVEPRDYNLFLNVDMTLGDDWEVVIDRLVEWSREHGPRVYVHAPTVELAQAFTELQERNDRHLWVEFIIPADLMNQVHRH